jgi:hypothetical protein
MPRNKDSAAALQKTAGDDSLEEKAGRRSPEFSAVEGGVGEAEAEIKRKQAARMAEITSILEKWKGTPIADKANAILDNAWAAKENLDKTLIKLKALLPTKEGVDAQRKAATEAGRKLTPGDSVTWKVGRTQHAGEFLGLTPSGSAKVQEQGKSKVSYVPANFLKQEEILDLTEDMVIKEESPVTGISDESLEEKQGKTPDYTTELADLDRKIETPLKKIESVLDFDDLIHIVRETGRFPVEQGKLLSAAAIIPILEEAKSGDAFTVDSPIVMAMPEGVRQKVQQLLDSRFAEVKGMIADVRNWNELIQVVKDIGQFTKPDGTPFKTADIIKVLQAGKLDKRLEPNSPWVSVFPVVLQDKINELLTPIEFDEKDIEVVEPEVKEEPRPVSPIEPPPISVPNVKQLPPHKPEEEEWDGPEIEPIEPPVRPDTTERPVPPTPQGPDTTEQPIPPIKDEPTIEPMPTGSPELVALRQKYAERSAELTNRSGVFGFIRRGFPGQNEKYKEVLAGRNKAFEEFDRARAEIIKGSIEKWQEEQFALADAKAAEFQAKRHWGQKVFDFYRQNPTVKRLKQLRTVVGIGLLGAGLIAGAPAVAATLGGGLIAWKLLGAAMSAPGTYELLRKGEEKFTSGLGKLKLEKKQQSELDAFVKENKLGGIGLFRNKEQSQLYEAKLLELQGTQAPSLDDVELDKMIHHFETTESMKGLKPSENPTYIMLVKEKGRRLKEMLDEVDAGEEGNEPEKAKFQAMVEAKKREKINLKIGEVIACLQFGATAEAAGKTKKSYFEGLTDDAQVFISENFNYDEFQKADQATRDDILKKLRRKVAFQFHPDRNQGTPELAEKAEVTYRELSQLFERLTTGRAKVVSNEDPRVAEAKALQVEKFDSLSPEAQTIFQKYESKFGLSLATLHNGLFVPGSSEDRKLMPAIEAELRAALSNNETIARESEEEVRSEVEGAVSAIEASGESVEAKKAAVLGLLNTGWESANKELAEKAKTRKDVMKLTAVAVALIGGYLVSKFSGQEASATGAKPAGAGTGNTDGPFKPWSTIPDPKEGSAGVGQESWPVTNDISPRPEYGTGFVEAADSFKQGDGVIRFAQRVADSRPELFRGMSNAQIEKWSIDLLLQKGLITIDKAKGLVGYKFMPHPGDTARIISDASGKPIDLEFIKGVTLSDKPLRWIPLPQSELAGRDLASLSSIMDRVGAEGLRSLELEPALAARATARLAEAQRIRESLGGAGLKYFWQSWKPEPDAILRGSEDKLEFGL